MSELNAAAVLVLEVQTGDALARVTALDAALKGLGVTGLANAGKDAGQFSERVAKLESSLGSAHTELNKLKVANGDLARALETSGREVESLKKKLDGASSSVSKSGAVYRQVKGEIDGYVHSYREVTNVSKDAVKALNDEAIARRTQLSLGNDIVAMLRRRNAEERQSVSAGRTQYRALLENEARDRRAGLQQLMAASLDEQRTRKLALQQTAAAREDEAHTLTAGRTQYRALLENEARDRRAGLQQLMAASLDEQRTRKLALQQTAAAREDEARAIRAANARQSQLLADAAYQRASDLKRAQQAERAAIALESGHSPASVTSRFGAAATTVAQTQGLAAVSAEVSRLQLAQNNLNNATAQGTRLFHGYTAAQWDAHAALRGVAGAMGQLWMTYGALAPLLAGAAVGATIKAAMQSGMEFEHQLTFVKALGGESAEAVSRLGEAAKNLAKDGLFGPVEIANGLRILAQAGLDANEALLAIPHTLDLATVGEMKMEQAALTLAGVMNAFGKNVGDMGHIGDVFAKAAAVSQVSVTDMTEAMKSASVVDKQSHTNIPQAMFGERGAKEAIAMLGQTREKWRELNGEISNSQGFMRRVSSELEATTKGTMTQAFNTLKVTMIEAFDSTEGQVGKLATALKDAFGSDSLKSAIQSIAGAALSVGQAFAAAAPALSLLAQGVSAILPALLTGGAAWLAYRAGVVAVGLASSVTTGALTALGIAANIPGLAALTSGLRNAAAAAALAYAALGGGSAGLLAAFVALAPQIALVVAGITAVTWAIYKLNDTPVDKLATKFDSAVEGLEKLRKKSEDTTNQLNDQLAAMGLIVGKERQTEMDARGSLITQLAVEQKNLEKYRGSDAVGAGVMADVTEGRIKVLQKRLTELHNRTEDLYAQYGREDTARGAVKFALDEKQAAHLNQMGVGTRDIGVDQAITEGRAARNPYQPSSDKYAPLLAKSALVVNSLTATDEQKDQARRDYDELLQIYNEANKKIADAEAKKQPKPKLDRAALGDVTSIGKQAELEYQAELKRIDLRDQAAQVLQRNDLLSEKQYQDLQDEISKERIAAALGRIEKEGAEIKAAREGANPETARALDNKQGELNARKTALVADAENKRIGDSISKYGALMGLQTKYAKDLGKLREENALLLDEQQKQYDLSLIADPVKLAGVQAEMDVAGRYRTILAQINEEIAKSADDPQRLSIAQAAKADATAQMALDKQAARSSAEAWAESQRTFEAGWDRALTNFRVKAADSSTIAADLFNGMAQGLERSFADFLFNPFDKGLKGMLQGFLQMLQRMVAEAVAADLTNKIMGSAGGGKSGGGWLDLAFNAASLYFGANSGKNFAPVSEAQFKPVGQALGGAWEAGVQKFATGAAFTNRVVSRPTAFRHAGGVGEMGEAGPESIMPLTRMSNGKLGVASAGGGGQTITLPVNVASGSPAEVKRAAGAGAREALGAFAAARRYA